ncbi:hypothetical protein ACHAQH_000699 [Verticillium albo-atrum]
MTDPNDHNVETDTQHKGYRGIHGCRTHAEALEAMEDDLDCRETGENIELKTEVSLLLKEFYDKINKYTKSPVAHRDIFYVKSIKKAVEAAIQHKEGGEAFSHRLPSSAQMLVLRYTHQSGTLEEDICSILVDYQVTYGAPVPFLGFGYAASPVHELLVAPAVQAGVNDQGFTSPQQNDSAFDHVDEHSEDLKEQSDQDDEQSGDEVDSVRSESSHATIPVEDDSAPNFTGANSEFDQMDFNAWNLKRTMKLREDLRGLRAVTAEITTVQRTDIDALKSDNEEKTYLLSIMQQQLQGYRKELQALKAQLRTVTPPRSQHSKKRSVDLSLEGDAQKRIKADIISV